MVSIVIVVSVITTVAVFGLKLAAVPVPLCLILSQKKQGFFFTFTLGIVLGGPKRLHEVNLLFSQRRWSRLLVS